MHIQQSKMKSVRRGGTGDSNSESKLKQMNPTVFQKCSIITLKEKEKQRKVGRKEGRKKGSILNNLWTQILTIYPQSWEKIYLDISFFCPFTFYLFVSFYLKCVSCIWSRFFIQFDSVLLIGEFVTFTFKTPVDMVGFISTIILYSIIFGSPVLFFFLSYFF